MFIIYDLVFLIFSLIYLPIYLFRKKFHSGFLLRLGILPKDLSLERPIWLHAVSVGEVMAIKSLLEELRKATDKKFVISTVTATGNKIAQGLARSDDFVTYLPLDLSFIVKRVINRINPAAFIIAETEIWPNLISYLYRRNIPIIIVNGRISDASFKGYLSIKFLLKPILKKVLLFCVQTERDAERLMCLGASSDKIQITGNMKFDIKDYTPHLLRQAGLPAGQAGILKKDYTDYRSKLKLGPQEKLLLAGSTHAGEEEIILGVYKDLLTDLTDLRLLIAPRHPQRCKDVAQIVSRFGFRSVFTSSKPIECPPYITNPVFILDTVGELMPYYQIADIIFVGGSLVKKGGHNILEPASLTKPILFGPYMFNFRDIADLFLNHKAAIMTHNQEDLKTNIRYLFNNSIFSNELGQRARGIIMQNQGATKRNVGHIRKIIVSN